MSHSPADLDISLRYPHLLKTALEKAHNQEISITIASARGATTFEAIELLNEVKKNNITYDMIIVAYGINDALPRGLTRQTRSRLIRLMYTLKLNKTLRLACRYFLLNPLEYCMQYLHRPYFYNDIDTFVNNILCIMDVLNTFSKNKPVYILPNPISNYRFRDANTYIEKYNSAVTTRLHEKKYPIINTFKVFRSNQLSDYLAADLFHYGPYGHQAVAETLFKYFEKNQFIK